MRCHCLSVAALAGSDLDDLLVCCCDEKERKAMLTLLIKSLPAEARQPASAMGLAPTSATAAAQEATAGAKAARHSGMVC